MPNTQTAAQIAAYLLESQAVRLRPEQPFKWSSGWNSPIYCDNRVTLSYPHIRTYIKEALAQAIQDRFPGVQAIAGVATAGIAQGALVADILNLPYLYVRPEPKSHGMGNQIEGKLEKGQKIVLVEDLISTGGSSLKAAKAVQAEGGEVIGMAAIFTYGFKQADENFAAAGIPTVWLSHYNALLDTAASQGYISPEAITTLEQWRQQPETWGK
ncbi:orotate phosphoribosyltransferase [Rufibacter tibetensis]|uniref:Orotate phosphoribosyltransferase n=1 Tax=Rufibacter tibetensis TaxID=512763 RepID=A0A0P0D014_9BACT|nr:orotate phosphoribosyltransferase [Rufibacter tibetensis]ALJ00364.1 orotate phosphoribosyltransferase [Rufibacter tibetensis]